MRPGRKVVLSEPGNFPTDLYLIAGLEAQGLAARRLVQYFSSPRPGEEGGAPAPEGEGAAAPAAAGAADPSPNPLPQGERAKALEAALDDSVAVLLLTHVHYKSGAMHDMARLTRAAHEAGALVLWDLAHSAGAVPVDLNGCEADLAVGCGYKYLNGGPGAPAFAFVAKRHHEALQQPLTGWMSHAAPFAFTDDYAPAPGIERLLTGTPPILGLAALEEGVRLIADIGVERLHAKSQRLSQFLRAALAEAAADLPCVSPEDPAPRGSQLSYRHREAYALAQALIARGVIPDFRDPDVLRLGLAPAYLRFEDCWHAAQALGELLASGEWERAEFRARAGVN
jgi:kynureninase